MNFSRFLKKYFGALIPVVVFLCILILSLGEELPVSFLENLVIWESYVYEFSVNILFFLVVLALLLATLNKVFALVFGSEQVFNHVLATDLLVVFLLVGVFTLLRALSFLLVEKILGSYLAFEPIQHYLEWILLYLCVKLLPVLGSFASVLMRAKLKVP